MTFTLLWPLSFFLIYTSGQNDVMSLKIFIERRLIRCAVFFFASMISVYHLLTERAVCFGCVVF